MRLGEKTRWSQLKTPLCFCGLSVLRGQSNLLKPLPLLSADARLLMSKHLVAVFLGCLHATSLGVCPPLKLSFSRSCSWERYLLCKAGAPGTWWRAQEGTSEGFSEQAEKCWHSGLGNLGEQTGWTAGRHFSLSPAPQFRHRSVVSTTCYSTLVQFTSVPSLRGVFFETPNVRHRVASCSEEDANAVSYLETQLDQSAFTKPCFNIVNESEDCPRAFS